jgi:hypothetical protein
VKTCANCGQATREDDRFCPSCGQPTDPRRQSTLVADDRTRRPATAVATANVTGYLHALRRFWWLLVIGVAVALLAAVASRYTISLSPPGLEEKDKVSWTAESQLLVDSADGAHFRSKETFVPPADETGTDGETDGETAAEPPLSSSPDFNTIRANANTYPYVIEGDEVASYREEHYGDLPGTVDALGIASVSVANRIEPSEIPIIRLIATADTPDQAMNLADKTGLAFIGWLEQEQQANDIPRSDRMVVTQLRVPASALASEGPSTTLPVLIFLVVFAAFCVLAVILDRLVPPRQPRPARADVEPLEPVEVKKTA